MRLSTCTRSTRSTGRRRTALAGLAAAALSASMAMAAPVAHASPADPTLSHSAGAVVRSWSWYEGGGNCYAEASATWDRAANLVRISTKSQSTAPFNACRARATIKFVLGANGEWPIVGPSFDIPTSCAVLDLSCPATKYASYEHYGAAPAAVAPAIDHITVELSGR
jgi:hypothetical protein